MIGWLLNWCIDPESDEELAIAINTKFNSSSSSPQKAVNIMEMATGENIFAISYSSDEYIFIY